MLRWPKDSECGTERQSKWTKANTNKCWEKGGGGVPCQRAVREMSAAELVAQMREEESRSVFRRIVGDAVKGGRLWRVEHDIAGMLCSVGNVEGCYRKSVLSGSKVDRVCC